MSAAVGPITEPEASEPTVHDWLDRVRASDVAGTDVDDPLVATICAAAVDSLEIAASLETSGMSRRVVSAQYGQPDVFALAGELWTSVPFRAVRVEPTTMWRSGGMSDLGRGALYVAPALMLLALTRVFELGLAWWALPLAITWGWALGQVTAHVGYTLRGRRDSVGERLALGWLLVITVVSTAVLASMIAVITQSDPVSVLGAAGVTIYMVASAILLLRAQERLAAQLLVPGAIATLSILLVGSDSIAPVVVVGCIGGSAVATLLAAAGNLRLVPVRALVLSRADLTSSARHFAHGLLCGLALTSVAVLGAALQPRSTSQTLLSLPLLSTLGVMEWQLRTFRAGVERLSLSAHWLAEFSPLSSKLFRHALGRYVAATALSTTGVVVIITLNGDRPPYALLLAQIVLGSVYYVDLVAVSLGRLDIVIRCWLIGAAAGAGFAGLALVARPADGLTVLWGGAVAAVTVTFVSLIVTTRFVVSSAINH